MNNLSLTTDKVVITLNLIESGIWAKDTKYQEEIKQLAQVISDEATQFEVYDAYGVLLYKQPILH